MLLRMNPDEIEYSRVKRNVTQEVERFNSLDWDGAEVDCDGYANPNSAARSYMSAINKLGYRDKMRVCLRGQRVFLIKKKGGRK